MKKLKEITAAALLTCTTMGSIVDTYLISGYAVEMQVSENGDINGDGVVSAADIVLLQKYLVGLETLDENQLKKSDINENEIVNAFDAVLLRRRLLAHTAEFDEGEVIDSMIKINERNVKLVGRNIMSDGIAWLLHSGSAAEFTVSGESAELMLVGDNGVESPEELRPRYAVYVDGELIADKTMDNAEEKISIFNDENSVSKNVKIIMLSEAVYGSIGISGINVRSASKTPITPASKKKLSIEFIGDSITCAYGVEGEDNTDYFKTTTENFTKSYAYLAAQELNADYSAVCYSGHGVISGYSLDGSKNTDSLIPEVYELASKMPGYDENWDFSSHKNDVVVVNLGTNDINYVAVDPQTRSQEFIEEYVKFLMMIRKNNSDSVILCTVGTMGGDEIYDLIKLAVKYYSEQTGDEKVSCFKSAVQDPEDGYGSDWHPSAITQQNSALVMAAKIRKLTEK